MTRALTLALLLLASPAWAGWDLLPTPTRVAQQSEIGTNCTWVLAVNPIADANPITRTYTALVPTDDGAMIVGGAHSSHPGNDVDHFRWDPLGWTVEYLPELPAPGSRECNALISGGDPPNVTPLGRPWSGHYYQQAAWVRGCLVLVNKIGTWRYCQGTWQLVSGGPLYNFTISTMTLLYDPLRDRLLAIHRTGPAGVYVSPADPITWPAQPTPLNITLPGTITYVSGYDAICDCFYLFHGGAGGLRLLYKFFPATLTLTQVTSFPATLTSLIQEPTFDFDPTHRTLVWFIGNTPGGPRVWTWAVDTDAPSAWAEVPQVAPKPAVNAQFLQGQIVWSNVAQAFLAVVTRHLYCGVPGVTSCGGGGNETWRYMP